MRKDAQGLFWHDVPKEKYEPVPPERTWESPDYLPYLEEARAYAPEQMSRADLAAAAVDNVPLIYDVEIYPNYFLVSFVNFHTGAVFWFEMTEGGQINTVLLNWILDSFLLVGFNNRSFDDFIVQIAAAGKSCKQMKWAADQIIAEDKQGWRILQGMKVKKRELNTIDLISVAPLQASLKIYAGRLHAPRMQELPFRPDTILTDDQISIVRYYNLSSDLVSTCYLFANLEDQLTVRVGMSAKYGVDLRSKSDAQIAEAVISRELERLSFSKPRRPEIPEGTTYFYKTPAYVSFKTLQLREVLRTVEAAPLVVTDKGSVKLPESISELPIAIGSATYKIGIGGLHSQEKKTAHFADDETLLLDRDVASYYPAIILTLGLCPSHLGENFLVVYRSLVDRRLEAKKKAKACKLAGDKEGEIKWKIEADMLKIVVNGSFGKLLSKWSALYAPDLGIQVTITGQLCLLMLIETLEGAGVQVVSANTDGIVIKCPKAREAEVAGIVATWEKLTGFETEEARYLALFSRDVNNYVAVKEGGKVKCKGDFSNHWANPEDAIFRFHKNPECLICIEAITTFLTSDIPIEKTIRECREFWKFVCVRTANKGGAVKSGAYVGKAIRWYYGTDDNEPMVYAEDGYRIPDSEGAVPCADLLEYIPENLDFARYISIARTMLADMAFPAEFLPPEETL